MSEPLIKLIILITLINQQSFNQVNLRLDNNQDNH